VSLDRYGMISTTALDVSRTGLLVRADGWAQPNEIVLVHLFTDVTELIATTEVTRLVQGRRTGDRELALGLRFTRVSARRLGSLLERLRGAPPPPPRRSLRRDYAAAVRAIAFTRTPAPSFG
jgi:hypothetical protein